MRKQWNVGMVSFGYMGRMHSMCYENQKFYYNTPCDVHLYAVVTSKSLDELPVRFEKRYDTVDELLADPNVDIVDICSPNYMHKDILIKAIQAGKHIYCEKPLTTDYESARAVMDAAKASAYNGVCRIAFEYRFVPAIIRAKQLIEQGDLGRIINFNFKYYGCEFLDPERPISWQSTRSLSGGGVLYAMGTHAIDLINYLVGGVEQVYAQQKTHFKTRKLKDHPEETRTVDIEDIINVTMLCKDDVIGSLLLSQVAAGSGVDLSFEIYGEKGTIKFDHKNANVIQFYSNLDPKAPTGGYDGFKEISTTQQYGGEAVFPPPRVTIAWTRFHIASIHNFLQAITEGTEAAPDLLDGYSVQCITDAIYRSAESGQMETVETVNR